jgi:hypothetical protein
MALLIIRLAQGKIYLLTFSLLPPIYMLFPMDTGSLLLPLFFLFGSSIVKTKPPQWGMT